MSHYIDPYSAKNGGKSGFKPENVPNPLEIKHINFNYADISEIPPWVWEYFPNVEIIEAGYNKIADIQDEIKKKLPKLRVLNLVGNKLSDSSYIPDFTNLKAVHLNYNPGLTRVPAGFRNVKNIHNAHMMEIPETSDEEEIWFKAGEQIFSVTESRLSEFKSGYFDAIIEDPDFLTSEDEPFEIALFAEKTAEWEIVAKFIETECKSDGDGSGDSSGDSSGGGGKYDGNWWYLKIFADTWPPDFYSVYMLLNALDLPTEGFLEYFRSQWGAFVEWENFPVSDVFLLDSDDKLPNYNGDIEEFRFMVCRALTIVDWVRILAAAVETGENPMSFNYPQTKHFRSQLKQHSGVGVRAAISLCEKFCRDDNGEIAASNSKYYDTVTPAIKIFRNFCNMSFNKGLHGDFRKDVNTDEIVTINNMPILLKRCVDKDELANTMITLMEEFCEHAFVKDSAGDNDNGDVGDAE